MFFWLAFPFVRIVIAFSSGIAISLFFEGYEHLVMILLIVALIFLIGSVFFKRKWFLTFNWFFGFILISISFLSGYMRLYLAQKDNQTSNGNTPSAYRANVLSHPVRKGNYYTSTVKINLVETKLWESISYKIKLYVKTKSAPFSYGDEILVDGTPRKVEKPKNPNEFNYHRYLTFLGIDKQHFIDSSKVIILSSENGNQFISSSLHLRSLFSSLLEQYIKTPQELEVAKALLLGNKSELGNELKNIYATSGAMHILAVSGLHVGIIYIVILFFIKIIPKKYQKKWLIALIAIPLLWTYAFITGLSPSVLRAVILLSIIAIGNTINRQSSFLNMLAISASILLILNPHLLMQVGFQLSYSAVLGIIFIFPEIRKLWMPSSKLVIFFWNIIAISIATQIATFPLSILYFHRFPPYFIISNLLVIPIATLLVWTGVIFFLTSIFSNMFAAGLGFLLAHIIRLMNMFLSSMYQLPGSNVNTIYLTVLQTWIIFFFIIFFFSLIITKDKLWANMASISLLIFSILIGYRWVENNKLKQLVIYDIGHHYSIDLIQSGELASFMDSSLYKNSSKINFHIRPSRLSKGITGMKKMHLKYAWKKIDYGEAIVWNNISILILNTSKKENYPFDLIISNDKLKMKSSNITYKGYRVNKNKIYTIN